MLIQVRKISKEQSIHYRFKVGWCYAMPRYNYDWSDSKLQKYINEGRGQKRGKDYLPWLNVHSIASRGRVSRIFGWKTGRVHHFLTDNEKRYFYLCEWSDKVVDIREHYPLIDLYEMTEILDEKLMDKLIDRRTGTPHILTCTFLITIRGEQGKELDIARSIKEEKELEKKSVIERYEIIRRYFQYKNIPWGLVTASEINATRAKNIEWIHNALFLEDWGYSKNQVEGELQLLIELLRNGTGTIRGVIEQFEKLVQCEKGKGLLLFKHLLATKQIAIDMDKPFSVQQPLENIKVFNAKALGSDERHAVGG